MVEPATDLDVEGHRGNHMLHARWMTSAARNAVVFDNDGLLLDTESVWTRAEQDLFERRGLEFTPADKRELVGTSAEIAGGDPRAAAGRAGPRRGADRGAQRARRRRARARGGGDGRRARAARTSCGSGGRRSGSSPTRRCVFVRRSLEIVGFEDQLRRRRQRPRSRRAEAGARPLPGGLPPARGRGRPRRWSRWRTRRPASPPPAPPA